jgi:hypothetical protein
MDVAFSNGEKRQYERLKPDGDGAVLVVPMLNHPLGKNWILLVVPIYAKVSTRCLTTIIIRWTTLRLKPR